MAYSEFNLNKFIKTFNLLQSREPLFNHIQPLEATPWLKETFAKGMQLVRYSIDTLRFVRPTFYFLFTLARGSEKKSKRRITAINLRIPPFKKGK